MDLPSRLPSLMLADKSDDEESRELFLLSNKSIRKTQLPEAYGKARRSSCGWLLTVGKDFSSQLVNPLSREIINLPKLDTFPKAIDPSTLYGPIQKVVLLMESKLVFVMWDYNELGFCHIGDNKWTSIEPNKELRDITFYNGHIYCFDRNNNILACNVNGKDPAVLVDVATMPRSYFHQDVSKAYIVGLDDDKRKQLLVIYKEAILHHWQCPLKTQSFKVVAYDLESGNLSEVKDFGRKTLFLGLGSSFWTEDTTGVIKGNCVYHTDDVLLRYIGSEYTDMGIYHLSDGTIKPLFAEESGESRLHDTPPLWLQPMRSFFTM